MIKIKFYSIQSVLNVCQPVTFNTYLPSGQATGLAFIHIDIAKQYHDCRIHHVIDSMTTIDLIINLGQAFWSRRPHFLNSPLRRCEAVHCLYISVSYTFVIV